MFSAGRELGLEAAGIQAVVDLQVDYIGTMWADGSCDNNTEHSPDMCITDRYHLCARSQPSVGWRWWDYTHCLFMQQQFLKCGNNGYCTNPEDFFGAMANAHETCAAFAKIDAAAVSACARSPAAIAMQQASFARSAAASTTPDGKKLFAPIFVDGKLVDEGTKWRDSPNALVLGKNMLEAICAAYAAKAGANGAAVPDGCSDKY